MSEQIPLFPLQSVLFPRGRLPLQIFEIRYLDLVKECMRNDSAFGVVLIEQGEEVIRHKEQKLPALKRVGTSAKIVAWDGLPNQRLAVTIEGQQRFRLLGVENAASNLLLGEIEWIENEAFELMSDDNRHMPAVLHGLLEYEEISKLDIQCDFSNAVELSNVLSQLLPVSNLEKQELLEQPVNARLDSIHQHLQLIGGE